MDGSATSGLGADRRSDEPAGVVGGGESYGFAERAGFSDPAGDAAPEGADATAAALREPTGGWPRIGDYWPDAPHRMGPPADYDPGSTETTGTQMPYSAAAGTPQDPAPTRVFAPPPPPRRPWLRVLLGAIAALVFLGGSVITLARLVIGPDDDGPSVPAAGQAPQELPDLGVTNPPVSIEPAPRTTPPTSAPAASPTALPFDSGSFELASNVIELNLTVVDLGNEPFQVSTPEGSGLTPRTTVDGDDVRLVAQAADRGTGRLDVRLNERISWSLKMTGGMRKATFALADADLRGIELLGGATRIDMALPSHEDTLPIRMTGGVNTWTITTRREVPVRAVLRKGGGEVVLNGRRTRGVDRNTTLRARVDGEDDGGLAIDAVAGLGTLTVNPATAA